MCGSYQTSFMVQKWCCFELQLDTRNNAHCGWPELPSQASLVRAPAEPHGRARILTNQVAVGIPKM